MFKEGPVEKDGLLSTLIKDSGPSVSGRLYECAEKPFERLFVVVVARCAFKNNAIQDDQNGRPARRAEDTP